MANIFQQPIRPVTPKVLPEERIYVYVPRATKDTPGIASFEERDFNINAGHVTLTWPMSMQIEQLSDPLDTISRNKLLSDEFEHTGNEVSITNPATGVSYKSSTAEVKLNRKNRNAFVRPDLVMLDNVSDFESSVDPSTQFAKYKLKRNDPLEQPSLIQVDKNDFQRVNGVVSIRWPYAHDKSGTSRTNGYGLVKIGENSEGYLKYTDNGLLEVDFAKIKQTYKVKPTYGADASSGFTDYADYVENDGYAKVDENGFPKLKLTKDSVGLSNVANKAFADYVYEDFGQTMKTNLETKFLDRPTWNNLFADWAPPTADKNTPQKWLTKLDAEDQSIWDSIHSLKLFLGYFQTVKELELAYPASQLVFGSTAFVLESRSYWAVRPTDTGYEWYDTYVDVLSVIDYMETNAQVFKPDGVASAGRSGMWAQSDHVHPTDTTRLSKTDFIATNVTITSELDNGVSDFVFHLGDAEGDLNRKVNIPYVRKAKTIHNRNGQTSFVDTEASSESYWRGTNEDFLAQKDNIPNNTIMMVDDGEDAVVDGFITKAMLDDQGITIDPMDPTEKFVTISRDIPYNGLLWTLKKEGNRYKAETMNLLSSRDTIAPALSMYGGSGWLCQNKSLKDDCILYGYTDTLGPHYTITGIHKDSVVSTAKDKSRKLLTQGSMVKVGAGTNILEDFNVSSVEGQLIVSDGFGAIKARTNTNNNRFLITVDNNKVAESALLPNNLLRTSGNEINVLDTGKLLLSGANNTITTFNTTIPGRAIVASDNGSVKEANLTPGKLVYTGENGILATMVMNTGDVGKYVGVNADGEPTLITPPSTPSTLPVTTYTSEPGSNLNGTVICRLNSDPGVYSEGVLYLW